MITYQYKAKDKYGKTTTGTINGADKSSVAKHLNTMGYTPIAIEEVRDAAGALSPLTDLFKGVSLEDQNLFTRQLLTLQKSGIPLLTSLDVLEKQTKNTYFKNTIRQIASLVEGGMSLSDALGRFPAIFSDLYVNMVKAGEASGQLDEVLERLADFGEREIDTRSKIKSATRYPLITLGALIAAFFVVVTFVIPRFAAIFAQFKADLPLPTKILLNISFVVRHYWYVIALIVAGVIYAFKKYISTKHGRFVWDGIKIKIPIFGPLILMFIMARFSRIMSILLKSGLPVLQVLDMTSRTVGNAVVAQAIVAIEASAREGKGLAEPMRLNPLFPPIVVNMIAVGEDTGKIDELLMRISEYYDQQGEYMIKNLSTTIEPIFVLILGVMVLTMALAIFLPMWNLISIFKH